MTSPFATGTVGTYSVSGNSKIDPLVWLGYKWGSGGSGTSATVTYSFPTAGATWDAEVYNRSYADQEPFNNFLAFDPAQQQAARDALALWAEVANINFVEVPDTSS